MAAASPSALAAAAASPSALAAAAAAAASAYWRLFIARRRILRDAALVLLETAAGESDAMVLLLYPSCDSDGGGVLSARSSIHGVWRVHMMCGD